MAGPLRRQKRPAGTRHQRPDRAELLGDLTAVLALETGSLGFRRHQVGRWALPRQSVDVEVRGQMVRVKVGPYRLKAEHDDCARAAAALGLPVSEVARRAEQAAAARQPGNRLA